MAYFIRSFQLTVLREVTEALSNRETMKPSTRVHLEKRLQDLLAMIEKQELQLEYFYPESKE
jgi:hypothetical protein